MSKVKLTERNKLTLPGGEREMDYADATFAGMFLRVTPANARAFVLRYSHGGKRAFTRASATLRCSARPKVVLRRDFLADVEAGVAQEVGTRPRSQSWLISTLQRSRRTQTEAS